MPLKPDRRRLILDWIPDGSITTRSWLLEQDLSKHAIDNLVKSAQLDPVINGVYKRTGTDITWQGMVYFLQTGMKSDLTIGGISALDLLGVSHYLSLGKQKVIHLYGKDKLPAWVNEILPDVRYIYHNLDELTGNHRSADAIRQSDSLLEFTAGQIWKENKEALRLSCVERAYLEMLMDVPQKMSFEHADQIMQGLTSLSPRKLQKLLTKCQNIKVKRLFLWMADRQRYNWLERLNVSEINLGSGKRVIAKNGTFNNKYQITVPDLYE